MKKLYTLLLFTIALLTYAQAPQGFNYQATVRNSTGALIVNQNVNFKFNIMLNSATSLPVFSETHMAPTDDLGQVNLVIGTGTASTGSFTSINWGTGNYYLGIELNTGAGYIAMGTTQLLSVPYALYANSAGNAQTPTPNLAAVLAVNNGANNLQIKNLANPIDIQDAATKLYVDSKIPNGTNVGDNLTWNGTNWVVTSANTTAQLPQLTTITATGISPFAAFSGGTISGDGGFSIISKGVAWSTSPNPTINDNFTNEGLGANSFQSVLNNLLPGTSYYYRAYATNSVGTGYGMSFSLTTQGLATVTTTEITQISSYSALSGGNITSNGGANVTARGVCWSTSPNPTIALNTKTVNGSGSGLFNSTLVELTPAANYYVRAYATNAAGTAYGTERIFTTSVALPVLNTAAATSITSTTASSGGTIFSDGGGTITVSGIVWGTATNPTLATNVGSTTDGTSTGTFTSNLTGLIPGTTYYVRSYATNSAGTGYGNQITFSTLPILATVITTEIMQINSNSGLSGGNITSNGGSNVTVRGVCWSTSPNPTIALNTKTVNGSGSGLYSSSITQLTPVTTYYLRAYATNAVGTAYGNELSFVTSAALPSLTTSEATAITSTTASTGGTISSDGGGTITVSGIVWGTTINPTLTTNAGSTTDGSSTGTFTSNLSELNPGTTYYVRAYATNSAGTAYGNQITLSALPVLATVITTEIMQINSNSGLSGGNITSNGGANVTARGVCWSTSPNPTIALNTKTVNGSGSGLYNSSITQLTPITTYYLRAYATNAVGTAYGNELSFVTSAALPTLTTSQATAITSTTASTGGTISSDGGGTITVSGIVWGTTTNPTLTTNGGSTTDGSSTGTFTSNLTGLNPGTTYYVRAYATNSAGTAYGNQITLSALPVLATVITTEIMQINSNSGLSGGNITSNGGANVTARGVCWSTSPNPTIALNTKTVNGSGSGLFNSSITQLTPLTTYYVRSYATNSVGTAYGNELSFVTQDNIVTIGTQIWRTTNLEVTTYRDGTPIPQVTDQTQWANLTTGAWCYYYNNSTNGSTYGKLYNWYAVAGIHDSASLNNPALRKQLAPQGWHVPSDAEWTTLNTFLGGESLAGGKMKSTGTSHWQSPNGLATNESGFTGLPAGYRGSNDFYNIYLFGFWWSSSMATSTTASLRTLNYNDGSGSRATSARIAGYSVRCLMD
jgi:uncharacterized protein (TIGR02145 family)